MGEQHRKKTRSRLSTYILAGLILGVAYGLFFGEFAGNLAIVGKAYVGLLQMSILPYMVVSLIGGIGHLSYDSAKRLALTGGAVLLGSWLLAFAVIFVAAPLAAIALSRAPLDTGIVIGLLAVRAADQLATHPDPALSLGESAEHAAELLELDRERESFAGSDEERIRLLHEVGRIEVEEVERFDDAVVTFRRILEIDPGDALAVSRLDALLEGAGRWTELAAHIEFQIDNATEDGYAIRLRHRLGLLTETELGEPPGIHPHGELHRCQPARQHPRRSLGAFAPKPHEWPRLARSIHERSTAADDAS